MRLQLVRSKIAIGVAGILLGATLAGAVSHAVAQTAASADVYNACVKISTGQVRCGTIRLNVTPACRSSEMVKSWNAEGPQGEQGVSPVKDYVIVRDPVRHDIDGDSSGAISGPLVWHPLVGTSATLATTDADDTLLVRWSAVPACFGSGDRYVRILVDGIEITNAPLSGVIGHIEPFPPVAVESPVVVEASVAVTAGPHNVTLDTAIVSGSSCVIGAPSNHLIVEVLE